MSSKKSTYARLFTPSGERLHNDPSVQPWNAYPRPQLRRDSFLCLNGWWDFAVTQSLEKKTTEELFDDFYKLLRDESMDEARRTVIQDIIKDLE